MEYFIYLHGVPDEFKICRTDDRTHFEKRFFSNSDAVKNCQFIVEYTNNKMYYHYLVYPTMEAGDKNRPGYFGLSLVLVAGYYENYALIYSELDRIYTNYIKDNWIKNGKYQILNFTEEYVKKLEDDILREFLQANSKYLNLKSLKGFKENNDIKNIQLNNIFDSEQITSFLKNGYSVSLSKDYKTEEHKNLEQKYDNLQSKFSNLEQSNKNLQNDITNLKKQKPIDLETVLREIKATKSTQQEIKDEKNQPESFWLKNKDKIIIGSIIIVMVGLLLFWGYNAYGKKIEDLSIKIDNISMVKPNDSSQKLQELTFEIDNLKKENELLKNDNDKLQKQINDLQKKANATKPTGGGQKKNTLNPQPPEKNTTNPTKTNDDTVQVKTGN